MTGRRFGLAAVCLLLLASAGGRAVGDPSPVVALHDDLELERLDDGLWLYRATVEMGGQPVESNGLVIAGQQAAIVIDTPWNDSLTALLLDWVEASFGEAAAVVSTHFHADRLGGISEVHDRGIASYGHVETERLALENDLPAPASTFEARLSLSTGSESVELFYPGPGHSPDNVVVWLPQRRLLFGGCLLKADAWSSLGYLGDAVVGAWAGSLEALLARYPDAERVLPGHGDGGGLEIVRHTLDLVERHLAGAAREGEAAGAAGRQRGGA